MFKLLFTALGYWLFDFWGILPGLLLGAFVDRVRFHARQRVRQVIFLETLFTLMGKLAKVDGHISQQEIEHVEAFMQRLGMTDSHRKTAIALFKKGADSAFDIAPVCQKFVTLCGKSQDLKQILLTSLIVMAQADGQLHQAEQEFLVQIASKLGYSQHEFNLLLNMVNNQSHFGHQQVNAAQALDDAYKALGVSKDSSDAEIKRAWRKLMSQYHPDKLIGQGMPEDMVAIATEQAKEVQLAYDLIKKSRNLA